MLFDHAVRRTASYEGSEKDRGKEGRQSLNIFQKCIRVYFFEGEKYAQLTRDHGKCLSYINLHLSDQTPA